MRLPVSIQIIDPKSVLTDADRHQIENMIWLRLSPFKETISRVNFKIRRLDHGRLGREHSLTITTKLKSGHRVKSFATRVSKAAVVMAGIDHMKVAVERRVRFESSWFCQFVRGIKNAGNLLFESKLNLFRFNQNTASNRSS